MREALIALRPVNARLLAALKQARCHYCGFFYGCPRTDNPCEVCKEQVAAIREAEAPQGR